MGKPDSLNNLRTHLTTAAIHLNNCGKKGRNVGQSALSSKRGVLLSNGNGGAPLWLLTRGLRVAKHSLQFCWHRKPKGQHNPMPRLSTQKSVLVPAVGLMSREAGPDLQTSMSEGHQMSSLAPDLPCLVPTSARLDPSYENIILPSNLKAAILWNSGS